MPPPQFRIMFWWEVVTEVVTLTGGGDTGGDTGGGTGGYTGGYYRGGYRRWLQTWCESRRAQKSGSSRVVPLPLRETRDSNASAGIQFEPFTGMGTPLTRK